MPAEKNGNPIDLPPNNGPHAIGTKLCLVQMRGCMFGTIQSSTNRNGYSPKYDLEILWEDGERSASFGKTDTLFHTILVNPDTPQEELRLRLKYA